MKKGTGKKSLHGMKKTLAVTLCLAAAASLSGCSLLESIYFMKNIEKEKSARRETEIAKDLSVTDDWEGDWAVEEVDFAYEELAPMGGGVNMLYAAGSPAPGYMPPSGMEYEPIEWNTEEYKYMEENGWLSPKAAPFSTFAADVDTASYANVRRMLLEGRTVPADAVRIEEMINYFDYDYPSAAGSDPFSVTTQIAPCPWNEDTQLLLIGLKAKEIPARERAASNLVFLVDVSGSMDEYNKLPLVQRAFRLLINELGENDTVSLVTYAGEDTVVLEGVPGTEKTQICDAIEDLQAGGGTNGSRGIITAYQIAEENFIEGGNNRVILATDGDLNIGMTDEGSLTRLIEDKAESGVFLSVLGFGEGNISDTNMEALADHGNGNYSYIDNITEARRVLLDEAGSTLFTVAKDVKLQVEFNPARVKGYRLIGYENRLMSAQDFADDTKDGGEIGSGHTVTALYEIAGTDSAYEISAVESRYQSSAADPAGTPADISAGTPAEISAETPAGAVTEKMTEKTTENMPEDMAEDLSEKMAESMAEAAGADESAEGSAAAPDQDLEKEWGILHIRYKEPDGDESILMDTIIDDASVRDEMDENLSWAAGVAQAGMMLRQSEYAGSTDLQEVRSRLKTLTGNDEFREEFVYLLTKM